MSDTVKKQIQALIDRETLGLNSKDPDLFLDFIHPDMVWPWPPTPCDHDPIRWKFVLGRFQRDRWRQYFRAIFDQYDLVHNDRNTVKIEVSPEEDAAFAILDIDSLWRDKDTKQEIQWKGRVCKFYTRMTAGDWKFIFQTGPLDYAGGHSP
jgi:ketosteroid isomerase-like protein